MAALLHRNTCANRSFIVITRTAGQLSPTLCFCTVRYKISNANKIVPKGLLFRSVHLVLFYDVFIEQIMQN